MNNLQKVFAITGTYHGSIVYAYSEGDARKAFHKYYKGESILYCIEKSLGWAALV